MWRKPAALVFSLLIVSSANAAISGRDVIVPAGGGRDFRAAVYVTNPSAAESAELQVDFLLPGNAGDLTVNQRIAPGATIVYEDLANALFGLKQVRGAARLRASLPLIITSRVYATRSTFSFAAIPERFGVNGNSDGVVHGLRQAGGDTYDLLLIETAGAPATIRVAVRDASGAEVTSVPMTVDAYEQRLVPLSEIVNGSLSDGSAMLSLIDGAGRVTMIGALTSASTGTTASFEMAYTTDRGRRLDRSSDANAKATNMSWAGSWNPTTTYKEGDAVQYNGSAYVSAINPNVGQQPNLTPAAWDVLAQSMAGSSAGGDLTGTYPNPTIANGAVTPAKINSTGAVSGQAITFNGTSVAWRFPQVRFPLAGSAPGNVVSLSNGNTENTEELFRITNNSLGITARFHNLNTSSSAPVLLALSNSAAKGIEGDSSDGIGVQGNSNSFTGVAGLSQTGVGVGGQSRSGYGVWASSAESAGLYSNALTPGQFAIFAHGPNEGVNGIYIQAYRGKALEVNLGRIVTAYGLSILGSMPNDVTVIEITSDGTPAPAPATLPADFEVGTILITVTSDSDGALVNGVLQSRQTARLWVKSADVIDAWKAVR